MEDPRKVAKIENPEPHLGSFESWFTFLHFNHVVMFYNPGSKCYLLYGIQVKKWVLKVSLAWFSASNFISLSFIIFSTCQVWPVNHPKRIFLRMKWNGFIWKWSTEWSWNFSLSYISYDRMYVYHTFNSLPSAIAYSLLK